MIGDSFVQEAIGRALTIPRLSWHGILLAFAGLLCAPSRTILAMLSGFGTDQIPNPNAPLLPLPLQAETLSPRH